MYMDGYTDAIRFEQIEQAIALAVVARVNRPHLPLEDCVQLAVKRVFCPCLSSDEGEGESQSMTIRAGIADWIVGYLKQGLCSVMSGGDGPDIERRRHDAEAGSRRIDREEHPRGTRVSESGEQGDQDGRGMPTLAERRRRQEEALDDALAQTFPASDPVAL